MIYSTDCGRILSHAVFYAGVLRMHSAGSCFEVADMTELNKRMNVNQRPDDGEIEIDLLEVFYQVKKRIVLLAAAVLICALAAAGYTKLFIPKTYSSTATIYLTPLVNETGDVNYTSLQTNTKLVNNVVALLKQDNIMDHVAVKCGFDSAASVKKVLSISNQPNTELIDIKATTNDPNLSEEIATETVTYFIRTMKQNLNVKNIEIVTPAKANSKPVGPSLSRNTAIGALLGFAGFAAYILFTVITDKRVKSKEEAEDFFGVPVLCQLPVIKEK